MTETTPLVSQGKAAADAAGTAAENVEIRIEKIRSTMQQTHSSRVNFSFSWRRDNLLQLKKMIHIHWDEMLDVLQIDLGKNNVEAACFELGALVSEIDHLLSHLKTYMKPRDVPSPMSLFPGFSKIIPQPRNGPAVLVIGPSNYPISISLMAVAGSLSAGNPTLLKPSELCPNASKLLSDTIPLYFDSHSLQVLQGGVQETTALLAKEWGLIHFTGSVRVGKIVAKAAASTLTPAILELGGKSPCYIDETCPSDIQLVANRILWGKTVNCGQNCISPDFLLVDDSKIDSLLPALTKSLSMQFGPDPKKANIGKLVAESHVKRAISLLEEVEEKAKGDKSIQILFGGSTHCDLKSDYVAPTVVVNPPLDCGLMQEEIFGPILPILTTTSRDEAVNIINSIPGTPLALYVFSSSDKVYQEMIQRCRSGTAIQNDSLIQFSGPHLPFGGLGSSGIGSYRGEASFHAFSHMLPSVSRPCFSGADMLMLRYQPYALWKEFTLLRVLPVLPAIPVPGIWSKSLLAIVLSTATVRLIPASSEWIVAGRVALAGLLRSVAKMLSP